MNNLVMVEALKACMDELYTIHSQFGDKEHARNHSVALVMAEAALKVETIEAPMGKNRFGVDVEYFHNELSKLTHSLMNRPPHELAQYLRTLAKCADPETQKEIN